MPSIWIGYDPREDAAFAVARHTMRRRLKNHATPIYGLILSDLQQCGLYYRPIEMRPTSEKPIMWDVISDAPMSTEHANARFLVPHLAKEGWALFMDGDMLVRSDVGQMFHRLDPAKAVYCVQHEHEPIVTTKMDGQVQTVYPRKNWTSFIFFNCDHPANKKLTVEMINTLPGRDLHRLCWLDDSEIGELDASWNYLVGHTDPEVVPDVVHFTDGPPNMQGYEKVQFADEWRAARLDWARGMLSLPG